MELRCLGNLMYFQSVPGTGDKDKEEDKGMTIEEKKEAERQRWGRAWMYIMDAQVGLKAIALTLFLNYFSISFLQLLFVMISILVDIKCQVKLVW